MSYDIAIVLLPVLEADAAAWEALETLIETEGPAPAVFQELHDVIVARFPCLSTLSVDEEEHGVWSTAPLRDCFRERAAVLAIQYPRADEVVPFVVAAARALGCTVVDWTSQLVHRPDGIAGLSLAFEDRAALSAPTRQQISDAAARLDPDGGPGFLLLERQAGDYVQVAGGTGAFTVEWRHHDASAFEHRVAGYAGVGAVGAVKVQTNGAFVTVQANERLAEPDAKAILVAFAEEQDMPSQFSWRDISGQFK